MEAWPSNRRLRGRAISATAGTGARAAQARHPGCPRFGGRSPRVPAGSGRQAPGCGRGWARAGVASGLNAVGAAASPARSPGSAVPSRPGSRICGTAHGRTGRRRRSCPAEARRARRRAGRSGKTGMLPTETRSRALALRAPIQPGRSRFTGTACECRASPAPAQAGLVSAPGWPCLGTGGHQLLARGGQLPDSPDRVRCGPAAHRGRRRDRAADVPRHGGQRGALRPGDLGELPPANPTPGPVI